MKRMTKATKVSYTYTPRTGQQHQTDLGNAQRLVARHGHDLQHVPHWGKWLVWDETRWAVDETGELEQRAKETVLALMGEATKIADHDTSERLFKHALRSQSAARIKAMIELAKTEPGIPVGPKQLDADPWRLNVRNGTLDLRTGVLHSHRREDYLTKVAPVAYDPQAACPTWEAFLRRILAEDTALIQFVQKAIGYALTGSTDEQCLFILHGSGANGKSTFLNTLSTMLGDYARQTPTDTLLVKRGDGISNDVARLHGARLVSAMEVESGRRLAEAQVKQLTGGDLMAARYLYQEFFEFRPQFKLFMGVNHTPVIQGSDHGIWRRIHLVPFTVTIAKEDQDKQLGEKLRAERSGILRWAVEGCMAWQADRLEPPRAVADATHEYRAEMDVIARFLTEDCVIDPERRVATGLLYDQYKAWCDLADESPISQRALATALKDRGFKPGRNNRERFWEGLGLREEVYGFSE
jgi:putative DNA primase/helicase